AKAAMPRGRRGGADEGRCRSARWSSAFRRGVGCCTPLLRRLSRNSSNEEPAMTVHFWIPGPLRPMTGGPSRGDVDTSGGTFGEALEDLFVVYPGIRDRVLTERKEIRQHVNVFVGKVEARTMDGLATPLASGTEISIIPAISGGGIIPRHPRGATPNPPPPPPTHP